MNTTGPSRPPEFSRLIDIRDADAKPLAIAADEGERAALAQRFGLAGIGRLEATLSFTRDGAVMLATGRMTARLTQICAISGEKFPVSVDEALRLRFVPELAVPDPDSEMELSREEWDEIDYTGTMIDPGEAVAQSLALAIDPFATGPRADEVRQSAGLSQPEETGPFAALKALKTGHT